jgi:hypothetical protein
MADPSDVAANKLVRKEFGRSGLDITYADIRVMHGTCYIRGSISLSKAGEAVEPKAEMERIVRIIRQRPGIKDVVVDVRYKL